MNTKHTPGPWSIGDSTIVYDDNGYEIAFIYKNENIEHAPANAKLIAAAPELLAALQYVEEHRKNGYMRGDQFKFMDKIILPAIAKATGE